MIAPSIRAQDPPSHAADYVFEQWQEYISKDGGFRVLMPGIPTQVSQSIGKAASPVAHIITLTTKAAEYTVSFTSFDRDLENLQPSKVTLDGLRDRMLLKEKGKLLSEEDVSIEGHPGRSVVIEVGDGIFRDRWFLVHDSLYGLSIFTPTVTTAAAANLEGIPKTQDTIALQFLGSFKLVTR
jgi:hypothetical protein